LTSTNVSLLQWFAISFRFARTQGLAAVALTDNPVYLTFPNNMTSSQVSSGLSSPVAAVALLGKPRAIALLLTLFMVVASSSSSELIAVSSILIFDVYKIYIKLHAIPVELTKVSHNMICIFGLGMAAFACIWNAIRIDLGHLFLVMSPDRWCSIPSSIYSHRRKQSKWGAITGAVGELSAGLIGWLTMAQSQYGKLTVTTTGSTYPTLAGNMCK
jgi:Na+/proline symporter